MKKRVVAKERKRKTKQEAKEREETESKGYIPRRLC